MKHQISSVYFLLTICVFLKTHASICGKFNVGGPCISLPATTTISTTTASPYIGIDSDYCLLACTQENKDVFGSLCSCVKRPESCYYTRNRSAKLSILSKRMYSGTPVVTECDYPGVVGIYNATSQKVMCMGVLLDESTIMTDTFCKNLVSTSQACVHVGSYQKPSDFSDLPIVVASSAKLLDQNIIISPNSILNQEKIFRIWDDEDKTITKVYTFSLSKPVLFDDACIQPACFPNQYLPLSDVDLSDCRIVGYGDTSDTIGTPSNILLEVKVIVDKATVASGALKYARVDGKSSKTGPCFNDQGAPLICNHKVTSEWVTIGVVTGAGLKCSLGTAASAAVTSLLKETTNHNLYDGLQNFKYVQVFNKP